jgi:hypothetical protein
MIAISTYWITAITNATIKINAQDSYQRQILLKLGGFLKPGLTA